jgi:hypothetical protein
MTINSQLVFRNRLPTGNRVRDPQKYWRRVQNICGFGHWALGIVVISYWLLVIGYWLLVIGYWLLVIGY